MFRLIKRLQNDIDHNVGQLIHRLSIVLDAIDDVGEGLQACFLLVEIIGPHIFVAEVVDNLLDLEVVLLSGILLGDGL